MGTHIAPFGYVTIGFVVSLLFFWDFFPGISKVAIALLILLAFIVMWLGYSSWLSKRTGQSFGKTLRQDSKSFLAFLILGLYPIRHLINLDAKFDTYSPVISGLLLSYAVASFIAFKMLHAPSPFKKSLDPYVYALFVFAAFSFITLSILKHHAFFSTGYDLGIYEQVIAGYRHGSLWYSVMFYPLLGIHVQPILFPLAMLYMLIPRTELLLTVQGIALASSIIPLYYLCKLKFKTSIVPFMMCLAFLLHPTLSFVALFDFHPETIALPLLIWAFLAIEKRKYTAAFWLLIIVATTKELFALFLVTFGVLVYMRGKRKLGVLMGIISLTWFFLALFVISPFFYSGPNIFLSANPYFGSSLGEAITTIVTHPIRTIFFLLTPEKLAYAILLLTPLGMVLPLLAPGILFLGIFEMGLVFLYSTISIQQIAYHHSLMLLAVSALATVIALSTIERKFGKRKVFAAASFVLVLSAFSFFTYGPFNLFYSSESFNAFSTYAQHGRVVLSQVPPLAAIAAPNWVTPHLSARKEVYQLANYLRVQQNESGWIPPEYIILDLSSAIADPKRNGDKLSQEEVLTVLSDKEFGIIAVEGTFVLLKRNGDHMRGLCKLEPLLSRSKLRLTLPKLCNSV